MEQGITRKNIWMLIIVAAAIVTVIVIVIIIGINMDTINLDGNNTTPPDGGG